MHELGFDHIHPSEAEREQLSDAIWTADNVEFTTVGVDVGSSTSHLMFARVHLQRLSEALSSRFVVVGRENLWRSPILLTPYRPDYTIDAGELGTFVDAAYTSANLKRDDIDSGAVILTGEALKRDNARAIADLFAAESGKFVCASAGHNMEALMAAHGSGAVELSRKEHKTFLNIDIGGGTTKFALVHSGQLMESAAIAVGGRLIAFGDNGEIIRIEGPAERLAEDAGVSLELGGHLSDADRRHLVETMTGVLLRVIRNEAADDLLRDLTLTPALPDDAKIDAVTFSGGVSEYIFGRETIDHGDLGGDIAVELSQALKDKRIPYPVYDPGQGIRATVIGASQFTVQVSGNTIHVSRPEALPLRNVPVIRLNQSLAADIEPGTVETNIAKALARFDIDERQTTIALAFTWEGPPAHERLHALAEGICRGLPKTVADGRTLILVMEGDIANILGVLLRRELDVGGDIISLDGVQLQEFDYIDIGELVQPADVAPLIIKSLLFTSDSENRHTHGHGHHHHHD